MSILCTGGAGFIGRAIVKALQASGKRVVVFDNFSRSNEPPHLPHYGDVREYGQLAEACHTQEVDEIVHLAAINGTPNFYERPDEVLEIAVRGMLNIVEVCRNFKIKKLIVASSSEVTRAPIGNEGDPLIIPNPHNARYSYSAGKIISEMLAIHSAAKHVEKVIIIRPFNVYGPGMEPGHVIPDLAEQFRAANGGGNVTVKIIGRGDEIRSFCYIDDFVDGFIRVYRYGEHLAIYNIGNPVETSIAELASAMAKVLGVSIHLNCASDRCRRGQVKRRRPNISAIRKLGFEPKIDLREGLRHVL